MMNKKLLRAAAALLVGVVGVAAAGCSFSVEQPDWLKQKLCDHIFDEEEILREPTCGKDGKTEKICSDCGTTKIVAIPATGEHVFDEGVTEDGMTTYTCTVCGEKERHEQLAPACKHLHIDDVGIDHPTGTCLDCGVFLPDLATSPVNVGDVASGWYRVNSEFSFELECLSGSISYGKFISASVSFIIPHSPVAQIDFDADMDDGYMALQAIAECSVFYYFSRVEWTYLYIGDLTSTLTIEDSDYNIYQGEISVSNMVFSRITRILDDGVIEKVG